MQWISDHSTGNGDGTFQKAAYFANLGGAPVFADFNGDGFLDIALVGAVLLNQGAGAPGVFASPKLYPIPDGTYSIMAGDFNGDGKQDLMATIFSTSSFGFTGFDVLYGNGDGTLKPAVTGATTPFNGSTSGDFNGDGVTDVALLLPSTATSFFTSVQILLGSTSGTFTQGVALPLAGGPAPSTLPLPLAAVALTNDGNLDLVVGTNTLNVFHGDGKGGFTASGSYAVPDGLFADVNGDGKPDLITASSSNGVFIFPGNGDGTFQAPPGAPVSGLVADLNNDGISDMVFLSPSGGNSFGAALGRGDGTFAILDQPTVLPNPPASSGFFPILGDFNGDGKVDTLVVQGGGGGTGQDPCETQPNGQLLSYLGTGTGQFQVKGTAFALGVGGVTPGVTGDFNSDGKLDLILRYSNNSCSTLLLFVPGNGDGTFATPVPLNAGGSAFVNLLAADLNNDKKLDFVWGGTVYLGNGDGTFTQIPLTIPPNGAGTVEAVAFADLNGDGILDAVASPGTTIYAGNGDGTFQTTPFYTVPLPPFTYAGAFAAGDVNGDGNPDLLLVETSEAAPFLAVYLGDGHGNFTQDTNAYYVATGPSAGATSTLPTRLNNQAPALPLDNKLDVLIPVTVGNSGTYELSLLNQTNPTPVKPAPITSTTALQASPATATPGAAITLTASVFGTNPTGSVSFTANGTSLGTEALSNGTATLQTSFASTGSYSVTATYPGDSNNSASTSTATDVTIAQAATTTALEASPGAGDVNEQITLKANVTGSNPTGTVSFSAGAANLGTVTLTSGVATLETSFAAAGSYATTATYKGDADNLTSTSSPVTVVIAAPDFTIAASPASGSVTPGQAATYSLTITPVAGYSGTVNLSCGNVPSLAACSFSPTSVTPSGGSPVSTTMTVTTAASTAMLSPGQQSGRPWLPAGGLAMVAAVGLVFTPNKIKRWRRSLRGLCWVLLLASVSFSLLGCGGGHSSTPSNPGTPAGSYTISVNASGSAGGPQHALSISLTVQ